jgi:hypothetical protein
MDYKHMTAPCGLDCFNCQMYLAGENEELRAVIAKFMNLPYDKAVCRGCRGEKGTPVVKSLAGTCDIYQCAEKKGIGFCCDCSDFPCDKLHPLADEAAKRIHNIKVFNLSLIKKMGLEAWAKDKAKSVRDTYFTGKFKL